MKRTLSVPGAVTIISALIGSSLLGLVGVGFLDADEPVHAEAAVQLFGEHQNDGHKQ
jgi:hypothetical protein